MHVKKRGYVDVTGQHAKVESCGTIERGGKKIPMVRRTLHHRFKPKEAYMPAMLIAHLLYPRHFPKPIASRLQGRGRETLFGQIEVDEATQRAVGEYYEHNPRIIDYYLMSGVLPNYGPHKERADKTFNLQKKILKESGIKVNPVAVNIGFTEKDFLGRSRPVFFEIMSINTKTLEKRISAMREGIEKTQAIEMLRMLEKHADENGRVVTHQESD